MWRLICLRPVRSQLAHHVRQLQSRQLGFRTKSKSEAKQQDNYDAGVIEKIRSRTWPNANRDCTYQEPSLIRERSRPGYANARDRQAGGIPVQVRISGEDGRWFARSCLIPNHAKPAALTLAARQSAALLEGGFSHSIATIVARLPGQ
jgi:hypothetical protein